MSQFLETEMQNTESDVMQKLYERKSPDNKVRIRYQNRNKEISERTIEPNNYYVSHGKGYLRVYCHRRGEQRTFAVRRIEVLTPEGESVINTDRNAHTQDSGPSIHNTREHSRTEEEKDDPHRITFGTYLGSILILGVPILIILLNLGGIDNSGDRNHSESFQEAKSVSSEETTPTPSPATVPKRWTYRGYTVVRGENGVVTAPELDIQAKNGKGMHYIINASLFIEETGLSNEELLFDYIDADTDGNGHLSWEEVVEFQRKTYRSFSYRNNRYALPPDEFLDRGGGDCEDFALYACGMLRFWGWNCKVAGYYPPNGGDGHALALVWSENPIQGYGYIEVPEGVYVGGEEMRPGCWIPIDYDQVGAFSEVMGTNWQLWDLEELNALYWREM